MFTITLTDTFANEGDGNDPSHDPLKEGYLDFGNALAPIGEAVWQDESLGQSYGNGTAYEHVETYGMAKVASRHRGTPRGHS